MTDGNTVSVVELVTQRLDQFAASLKRVEDKLDSGHFVTRELHDTQMAELHRRIGSLEETRRWLIRVVGAEGLGMAMAALAWAAQQMG